MKTIYIKTILITLLLSVSYTSESQIINTVAGNGVAGYSGDGGPATAAEIGLAAITIDSIGELFIADYDYSRVRKVDVSGIITTVVGTGTNGFGGDNGPAISAELSNPSGICFDHRGNMFIADFGNNRIRKVALTGIITTIAGIGVGAYSGDGGPATSAEIYWPAGLTVDSLNNLYIADYNNYRVRKVNTSGIITTFAGNGVGTFSGDGGLATAAGIYSPDYISFDAMGNLYISSEFTNRVRKVDKSGIITTVAGTGMSGFSGNGGHATSAELEDPDGVAFDNSGNIYIADEVNNEIRVVNSLGVISAFGGNGVAGFSGDGGPPISAELFYPENPVFDNLGDLYIVDANNLRIRKISKNSDGISQLSLPTIEISVFPDPNNGQFIIETAGTQNFVSATIEIYNVLGEKVYYETLKQIQGDNAINISNQPAGVYLYRIYNGDSVLKTGKIVLQ